MSIWMIYTNDTPGMSVVEFRVYIYGMGGDRHGRHASDWILHILDGSTLKEGNGINGLGRIKMLYWKYTWILIVRMAFSPEKDMPEYGVCYCGKYTI